MKSLNPSLHIKILFLFCLVLTFGALVPRAQATDSGGILPNFNTADGSGVLTTLGSGARNSGFGFGALLHDSIGNDNTATGYTALNQNQAGNFNTAVGSTALFNNFSGHRNTATGYGALEGNFSASDNTGVGYQALFYNGAIGNTAVGSQALLRNVGGTYNTAIGISALVNNAGGNWNTATGAGALALNQSTGSFNTADGGGALLLNTTGSNNTALGFDAGFYNTTGNNNIALGANAGFNLSTGDNNVDIGNVGATGDAGVIRIGTEGMQAATYIAGILNQPVGANSVPILIDSTGKLGTAVGSSLRFKKAIKSMDQSSEAILSLRPVTFHYKTDAKGTAQFGLIAEEVDKVDPDLVVCDRQGKPYTVRYDAVNAMLLNEFLKEHRKVEKLEAALQAVNEHLKEQDAQIRKVSAQIQTSKSASKVVLND